MFLFRRQTIGRQMAFMLAIPFLGLVFFAGTGMLQRFQLQREAYRVQTLTGLAATMSAFVHETQKERGLTGGFLGSQGQKFRDELTAQRLSTDKSAAELNRVFADVELAPFGATFQQALGAARRDFYDKLGSHRRTVDALTITARDGISYYTQLNTAFLDVIASMDRLTSHTDISSRLSAYAQFLLAKEKTGIERALLTNAFSRGKFESIDEFQKVVTVIATQDTFLQVFLSAATPAQRTLYHQKMQGRFLDETARLRRLALDSFSKADFGGVDASHWFAMITGKINLMKEVEDQLTTDLLGVVHALATQARNSLIGFTVMTPGLIGLASLLAYRIARRMTRATAVALQVARGIAEGKLQHTITVASEDEIGQLLQALQTMCERLQQIVSDVQNAASNVSVCTHEIVQGNSDLSQRTQEQASALEETASSMEEMTSTVQQNANNALQATHLAANACAQAEEGGAVVRQAVAAMADLSRSSTHIADIIGVIDSIAFQTNLLALNAAVEAARAGDQGRGFAVVAAEVRKLAQRSAEAAKEIKTLIVDSVEKVANGTRLVDASGQALQGIVTSVQHVSNIVAEIAAASREQAAGIEQVNKAVLQMDEMTQQNAAMVEQAAAASTSVDTEARHLQHLMSFFQMHHATSPAAHHTTVTRAVAATDSIHLARGASQASASGLSTAVGLTPQADLGGQSRRREALQTADKDPEHDWVEF
ncbi:MAG: nitrate- and nitrite sensing domain-containing protein [Candidatus Tectimicrobiota bacterium]